MTSVYENLTKNIEDNINYLHTDLLDLSTYLTINSDIRRILNAKDISKYESQPLIWEQSAPTDFVRDMVSIKSHVKTLILYPENGLRPFYISQDESVYNKSIEEVRELAIYKNAANALGDQVWTRINKREDGIFLLNNSDKIIISNEIFDWSKKRMIGFLSIGIEASKYEQICMNALQKENEGIMICSQTGEVLVRAGQFEDEVLAYVSSTDFLSGVDKGENDHIIYNGYYVFYSKTTKNGNVVCYMLPRSNWSSELQNVRLVTVVLALVLLLGLFPLFMLVTTIISKPLNKLNLSMQKFQKGDFDQKLEVTGYDEIGEVTECYNQMVKEIKELIDTNYVMVLRERQSELDALQAQINPHFLYNALDSLYWQAINTNSEKLAEDIFSLSQLFRLLLSQGQSMIPLAKEKDLIYHYLQIQKMRFEKKLNFTIDMEEDILEYKIPKLIIQPFVENAIVHGLERKGEKGSIEINGCLKGDYIRIEIKDNGMGMTQEQLAKVFDEETKEYSSQRIGRFAIRNIKERLNIKYHSDFKLDIQSKYGMGTIVTLQIPARYE
jgi:two-component system sensor histidine kinase YesM